MTDNNLSQAHLGQTHLSQGQTAFVHGGALQVDTDALTRARAMLTTIAGLLHRSCAAGERKTAQARTDLLPVPLCPAAGSITNDAAMHRRRQQQASLILACAGEADILFDRLGVLARRCRELADLLARVVGVYTESESLVGRLMGGLLGLLPAGAAVSGVLLAPTLAGAAGLGSARLGPAASRLMQQADPLVQPGMDTLARALCPPGSPASVNEAARLLSPLSAGVQDVVQGDRLTVSRVRPGKGGGIGASRDIGSALASLDRLGDIGTSKVPYSTVAVQKYVEDDGTTHWLLLVPGTRGERDTPIGWAQNVELMSSDNSQRLHADSARLALEALRRSGVGKGESVAVVGHSQGGIVAASLAAGNTGYSFTHIVTAGSPIAGHPIPSSTWVTAVEDRGELVSRLDGADNPARRTWVSVDGRLSGADASTGHQAQGTHVSSTGGRAHLTHGLNYQRATWQDAKSLGSTAVEDSDEHFSRQVRGRLVSTQYFTGRMSY